MLILHFTNTFFSSIEFLVTNASNKEIFLLSLLQLQKILILFICVLQTATDFIVSNTIRYKEDPNEKLPYSLFKKSVNEEEMLII